MDYRAQSVEHIFDIQGRTHYQTALDAGMSTDEALAVALERSRDGSRAPLPWDDGAYAGFSDTAPWMPIDACAQALNATAQQQDAGSLWHEYRKLIALRNATDALRLGRYSTLKITHSCIWFARETPDEQVWVAINFGEPVLNPWHDIVADVLSGDDAAWIAKNQCLIKRSRHGKAQ